MQNRKRILELACFVIMLLSGQLLAQDLTWIPFRSGNQPSAPEIVLLESNDSYVTFRIVTYGIWSWNVIGTNQVTYKRLTLKEESVETADGYPALPRVPVNVAAPTGATTTVTVTTISSTTVTNVNTAPFPTLGGSYNDYGMFNSTEIYTPNSGIYALSTIWPTNDWQISTTGYMNVQNVVGVDISTVRCKPALSQLVVADTVVVRVEFIGGGGTAVHDMGIFNFAVNMALINHAWPGVEPEPYLGTVTSMNADTWIQDWDSQPCDYLMVVPGQFANDIAFMNKVQQYAELRAYLSGLDVCIIKLGTDPNNPNDGCLDPVPWNFLGNQGSMDWSFMSIRNFTKGLWENGVANNTGNGHLMFLLLVGDARDDAHVEPGLHDWLIPSPRPFSNNGWNGGDRAYGLLHGNNPTADSFLDISVGRLPVGNATEMSNIYEKTLTYCVYTPDVAYRYNLLLLSGKDHEHPRNHFRPFSLYEFREGEAIWDDHSNGQSYYGYAHDDPQNDPPWPFTNQREPFQDDANWSSIDDHDVTWICNYINDGVGLVPYNGHGVQKAGMAFGVYDLSYLGGGNPRISNATKLHVAVSVESCVLCQIDPIRDEFVWNQAHNTCFTDFDGFAEGVTVKTLSGAIGVLASRSQLGSTRHF